MAAVTSELSPMARFCRDMEGECIKIIVGNEGNDQRSFTIPKSFICAKSVWFKKALEVERFAEGRNNCISLPEDCPEAFEACEYFLFNSDLYFTILDYDEAEDILAQTEHEIHLACKIWILGDKLRILGLADCAMIRLCSILSHGQDLAIMGPAALALCLQDTMAASPLRSLAVDYMWYQIKDGKATIRDFDGLGIVNGSIADLLEMQSSWHLANGNGFPIYRTPLRNRALLSTEHSSQMGKAMRPAGRIYKYNAFAYQRAELLPSCEDCGLSSGHPRCKSCYSSLYDCCNTVNTTYLCGECEELRWEDEALATGS